MSPITVITVICSLILSYLYYKIDQFSCIVLCDLEKCPYCFGDDLCDEFLSRKFTLKKDSVTNLFSNYFSVKNVFYASYDNNDVVIKKLAHNVELNKLDELICTVNNLSLNCNIKEVRDSQNYLLKLFEHLTSMNENKVQNFKLCTNETVRQFLDVILLDNLSENLLKNVWSILQVNVEPLLLQILRHEDGWNLPQYYGACGRAIVESDDGSNLNSFAQAEWSTRANLALQLLIAAKRFTEGHPFFRFYLTDISPDNIAVNIKQEVSFIDLENVVVTSKNYSESGIHYSSDFGDEDKFTFSQNQICSSNLSDHNYYAICKLLLSKNAPWPMMQGGLLHTPPDFILASHHRFFELIEICVNPDEVMNRFQAIEYIINYLKELLNLHV